MPGTSDPNVPDSVDNSQASSVRRSVDYITESHGPPESLLQGPDSDAPGVAAGAWHEDWPEIHQAPMLSVCVLLHTGGAAVQKLAGEMGRGTSMHPGAAMLQPPGAQGLWRRAPHPCTTQSVKLFIEPQHLREVAGSVFGGDGHRAQLHDVYGTRDRFLVSVLAAIRDNLESPSRGSPLFLESVTGPLLHHLLREYSNLGGRVERGVASTALHAPGIDDAIDYMESNLDRTLSLTKIAEAAGLSRYHFLRQFKAATGQTPHRYLMQRRLERAKKSLLDPRRSIGEIALATGFSSQSHLTTAFRKAYGVSPGKFRAQRDR